MAAPMSIFPSQSSDPYDPNAPPTGAATADFLGGGGSLPSATSGVRVPALTADQQASMAANMQQRQAIANNVPYGTPAENGGTATGYRVTTLPQGSRQQVTAQAGTTNANGTFAPSGYYGQGAYDPKTSALLSNFWTGNAPLDLQNGPGGGRQMTEGVQGQASGTATGQLTNGYGPGAGGAGGASAGAGGAAGSAVNSPFGTQDMVNQAVGMSNDLRGQGANVQSQQNARGSLFAGQGQNFNPSVGMVGGGAMPPNANGVTSTPLGGFTSGAQMSAGQLSSPGTVNPGSLGGVQNIAGRLGAAPTVGNVGDVSMGSAPGAVAGQLGSMGASNADQSGMLGRINGFLDAPEGPSVAQAQLQQSQAGNMADLIGAARSGRGGAGSQAQALRGAISAGSAVMSDTAGQAATLRAQEQDMLKNRQLNAMNLGGQLATAARGQDISYRGQDLSALQGDQSTALGARGQDLQGSMANQSTQLGLQQLQGQLASTSRGQDLSALQSDQGAQLGTRAQDLSALQGNQSTALGARGQDVTQQLGIGQINAGLRGQDLSAAQGNQQAGLAGQQLALNAGLGYGALANNAVGMGLQYGTAANQQGLLAAGLGMDANTAAAGNVQSGLNAQTAANAGIQQANIAASTQPTQGDRILGSLLQAAPYAIGVAAGSDERAKTDVSSLDAIGEHLRSAPGYKYRYKADNPFGEDPSVEHAGPMAQDLERGPFGKELVFRGPKGFRMVRTDRLSLVNHAALSSMRSELDKIREMLDA